MIILYFVLFGVEMAFYGKIYVRKSLILRNVIKKIKGCSVKQNGRKYSVKLCLSDIISVTYIEKKTELVFENIVYLFYIVVFFVLSFFKLFYNNC